MTDFSHLKKLDVTSENTAEYEIVEITLDKTDGSTVSPVLTLRPAGESNHKYMNALLRMTGQRGFRKAKKNSLDSKVLDKQRKQDKELYPEHVIVAWKDMLDSKGKPVKFSAKAAAEFLEVLPNWIFDGIRTFAAVPENFIDIIDSEEKAGN